MLIRLPWKAGPERGHAGAAYVSATRFQYRQLFHLPAVSWHAMRLRAAWSTTAGAVGVSVAADWLRRTTYSVSVWRSEEDLRRWLRTPYHVSLMREFRPRLVAARSTGWITESFDLDAAWREASRRLAPPQEGGEVRSGS